MGLFDFFIKKTELRSQKATREVVANRKAFIEKQVALFNDELAALPRADVSIQMDAPVPKNNDVDPQNFKFSKITDRRRESGELANFVTIDVETGSLREAAAILEISAIRFENYEPKELYTTFVKPNRFINTPDAYYVNGITKEMVCNAPRVWQILPSFSTFVGTSNIVGHNLEFDLCHLCRHGFELPKKTKLFDIMLIARSNGGYENYQMSTLCSYSNIFPGNAHHSHADCLAKGKLFKCLVFNLL